VLGFGQQRLVAALAVVELALEICELGTPGAPGRVAGREHGNSWKAKG
jgi:hypothetical protein